MVVRDLIIVYSVTVILMIILGMYEIITRDRLIKKQQEEIKDMQDYIDSQDRWHHYINTWKKGNEDARN